MDLDKLVLQLYDIGAVKFGTFKLKSGIESPFYIDLRVTVSHPDVLKAIGEAIWNKVTAGGAKFDLLCGVPYTALPFATVMSVEHATPMVMRRKEAKDYGTKKIIEGNFSSGQSVLIVEDIVTSGMSVMETVVPLRDEGLVVNDIAVLLDRQQGGGDRIRSQNFGFHPVLTISEVMEVLKAHNRISDEVIQQVKDFCAQNQVKAETPAAAPAAPSTETMTFSSRSEQSQNETGKKLLALMDQKKTNLCVSADLTKAADVLALAEKIGSEICLLKTHGDIVEDFDDQFVKDLVAIAEKHNFMIFEDRKFADIGNTVSLQYGKGVHKVADWSHVTNAHLVPGDGIIKGLKSVGQPKGRGLLLIAEMSSAGSLATGDYTKASVKAAESNEDFVIGFICQSRLSAKPGLIHMTPGVNLGVSGDSMGQQYNTPSKVVSENGADVIIVGRGIYGAEDPASEAKRYREEGWKAYSTRVNGQ